MGQWWDEFFGNPPAARVEKDPISEFGRERSVMYLTCFVYYLIGNAEYPNHIAVIKGVITFCFITISHVIAIN